MPKTQTEIDALADQVRASGVPDSLNRWLGMTPEKLEESETKVRRQVAADRNARSTTMPKVVGPKEQKLREQREGNAVEETTTPKAKKKAEGKPTKPEGEKPARAARSPAPVVQDVGTTPSAVRPGSKMATIKKLLARKNGCTASEVREACEWPSVSMPQQAKALGIELFKLKGDDGVTRYADHALA